MRIKPGPAAGGGGGGSGGLPIYYKKELEVRTTSANAISIKFGGLSLADEVPGSITEDLALEDAPGSVYSTTADITASGAGGLDTGVEANSTFYTIFAIYNTTTSTLSAVLSTSGTKPTLPAGYTLFRRVGEVYNDGSGDFVGMTRVDDNVYFEVAQNVFSDVALDADWDSYSLPAACPSGTQEWFLSSGRDVGGGTAFNIQVLRPGPDAGFEIASENVASSSTTNAANHAMYRVVDHPPMPSLGLTTLEVRCNGTGFGDQSNFCRGYRKAV